MNLPASQWISVRDRLPRGGNSVLALIEKAIPIVLICLNGTWYSQGKRVEERVTHWMPLPPPPPEDDGFEAWWEAQEPAEDCVYIRGHFVERESACAIWKAALASRKSSP